MKVDYAGFKNHWKDFLQSKGFRMTSEDDSIACFTGCKPQIRIVVCAGEYRTDTATKGCICGDFESVFNKTGDCPIIFDLTVSDADLWKAVELLVNAGVKFSNRYGRIVYQRGGLEYDPPLFNKKEKQECYRRV